MLWLNQEMTGHLLFLMNILAKFYLTDFGQVLFDRLEYTRTDEQQNIAVWDMQAWYGGDYHRLVFKSEGENTQNDGMPTDLERAELLYGYLVSSFWSIQFGVGTKGELSSDADMENYAVVSYQNFTTLSNGWGNFVI